MTPRQIVEALAAAQARRAERAATLELLEDLREILKVGLRVQRKETVPASREPMRSTSEFAESAPTPAERPRVAPERIRPGGDVPDSHGRRHPELLELPDAPLADGRRLRTLADLQADPMNTRPD